MMQKATRFLHHFFVSANGLMDQQFAGYKNVTRKVWGGVCRSV